MDVRDVEPRILHVELPPESLATYRAIHDGGGTYAVVLTVSVGIDGFIERELRRTAGNYPSVIRVDERDRMKVEIRDTTLQQVRDRLEALKQAINQSLSEDA